MSFLFLRSKIFEDSAKKGSVIVQGLEERVVKTKEQVLRIMEEGSLKRTTAATKMNASSSRSHTIFTITVRRINWPLNTPWTRQE